MNSVAAADTVDRSVLVRVSAAEATSHWLEHTKGPLDEEYYAERWYKAKVTPRELRSGHEEFRDVPVPKHALMKDILARHRNDVLEGTPGRSPSCGASRT